MLKKLIFFSVVLMNSILFFSLRSGELKEEKKQIEINSIKIVNKTNFPLDIVVDNHKVGSPGSKFISYKIIEKNEEYYFFECVRSETLNGNLYLIYVKNSSPTLVAMITENLLFDCQKSINYEIKGKKTLTFTMVDDECIMELS